ncbi:ribosome small subunit-dependent GTPase A [Thermoanaerobacterium sp. RBIITD]|uniref:ribosome small subunit-dependent GTPase A n=1 Tax=Thermoanaerobacterium sp. RBIITD TaxID=1550240 RepID=UPI000BB854A8|nr:ribosome small subunit-dependent GTPase A [Thermoanaerobacterium sp. RBIITD]SNX55590.1 ribosome biogenesis GTPase [Thermoanaerobacterium sp. RBIITD]
MILSGRIVKGIGGFYYVNTEHGIIECRARGKFRKDNIKPLVGDNVDVDTKNLKDGYILNIQKRKNELIRPPVSNVDQAVITFSIINPAINRRQLDKMLIIAEINKISALICLNKIDLVTPEIYDPICKVYESLGYIVIPISKITGEGIDKLKSNLLGKTSFFTGPSGVGKSSLINCIQNIYTQETGELSPKISRGKHTTRSVELMPIENGYILDTPGFASLNLNIDELELRHYFRDFKGHENNCRFTSCIHVNEPDCGVKNAVLNGLIDKNRYSNYLNLLNELKSNKRRK